MTEADSVHSTPRINSPIERHAESVDSFSVQPATGQPDTGERASNSPRPVPSLSNVFTFPVNRPASNVRPVNLSFDYRAAPAGPQRPERRRASVHTFVFRSYELIIASSDADLGRDVGLDIGKARTKLRNIREQLRRDREQAAARADLLTKAEARLSTAIAAAQSNRSVEG